MLANELTNPKRTLAYFTGKDGLSEAEDKLLQAAISGGFCNVCVQEEVVENHSPLAEYAPLQPKRPKLRNPKNEVRAEFIRFLSLGDDHQINIHEKGVQLKGAYITGRLDLENCQRVLPLRLHDCVFEETPVFQDAHLQILDLGGTFVPGIKANRVKIDGSLLLNRGLKSEGEVQLRGAHIRGGLNGDDGSFYNQGANALDCYSMKVIGTVYLRDTNILGCLSLMRSEINGSLICDGCCIKNTKSKQFTLDCYGMVISGSVHLYHIKSNGRIRFTGAKIGGGFNCENSVYYAPGRTVFTGRKMQVRNNFLIKNCVVHGLINLIGSNLNSSLIFNGSVVKNRNKLAVFINNIEIGGTAFFREGMKISGQLSMVRAKIDGDIQCDSLNIYNPINHRAMDCRGIRVGGSVYLAKPSNTKRRVKSGEFKSEGALEFIGAQIVGKFDCTGTSLSCPIPYKKNPQFMSIALDLEGAKIDDALILDTTIINGSLDLHNAHINTLMDAADSWPQKQGEVQTEDGTRKTLPTFINLDGLTYDHIAGEAPVSAKIRKKWLSRQLSIGGKNKFLSQPFEQLVKVLRHMGHDDEATKIAMFKQKLLVPVRIRKSSWLVRPFKWLALKLYGILTGYGYRPVRLFIVLIGLWLGCAAFYAEAARQNIMVPTDSVLFLDERFDTCRPPKGNWTDCQSPQTARQIQEYTTFNPTLYSLDLMLPVVDFQQESSWAPMTKPIIITTPQLGPVTLPTWFLPRNINEENTATPDVPVLSKQSQPRTIAFVWPEQKLNLSDHLVIAISWLQIIFGWVGSLLLAALVSGIVKKD